MASLAHVHEFLSQHGQRLIERSIANEKRYAVQGNQARRKRMLQAVSQGTHSNVEWLAVLAYYGGQCLLCGSKRTTKDHVQQVSKGGSDRCANLQPLCRPCNSEKHDVDYRWDSGEWAEVVGLSAIVGE